MSVVSARNSNLHVGPLHPAPPAIGRVVYSAGTKGEPPRFGYVGAMAVVGACSGAIVALIGFFVVGGLVERSRGHIAHGADWFLGAMICGPLVGAILAALLARRAPPDSSRFVGELGAATITGTRVELLRFADLTAMTPRPLAMGPMKLREIMVTQKDGKTRRWLLTLDDSTDGSAQFGDAALAAFSQMTPPSRS